MNVQTILRGGWLIAVGRLLGSGVGGRKAGDPQSSGTGAFQSIRSSLTSNFWSNFSRKSPTEADVEARKGVAPLNILVPFDFTDSSTAALDCAMRMARNGNAKITLLHAVNINLSPYGPVNPAIIRQELSHTAKGRLNALAALAGQRDIFVDSTVRHGKPGTVIEQFMRENVVDLVIIGRHGRHGLGWFVGQNVAEKVVRSARCPVLVLQENEKALL